MPLDSPYWLLSEEGKSHGFATIDFSDADTAEEAIAEWRRTMDSMMVSLFESHGTVITARLVFPSTSV
jgi:hypothetical protein